MISLSLELGKVYFLQPSQLVSFWRSKKNEILIAPGQFLIQELQLIIWTLDRDYILIVVQTSAEEMANEASKDQA